MNYDDLKKHIAADPALQALADAHDYAALAAKLAGPGTGRVSRGAIPRAEFVGSLAGPFAALMGRPDSDPEKQMFAGWLQLLQYIDPIPTDDPALSAPLQQAVADKIATQEQVDAALLRPSTLIEDLMGAGATATVGQLAEAYAPERTAVYEATQKAINDKAAEIAQTDPAVIELAKTDPNEAEHLAKMKADNLLHGAKWDVGEVG